MKNYQITIRPVENGYVVELTENMSGLTPPYCNNNLNGGFPRALTWIAANEAAAADIVNRETAARAK